MSEVGKPGSSRRKGDEYQDLTALYLVLKNYIDRRPFEIFLEYEKSGNLDDIVLFQETSIEAYQVKYAVNPLDIYQASDFIDSDSFVNLKKFADGWKILRSRYPDHCLTVCLLSNRGLDAELLKLVTPDGRFTREVIEDRKRGDVKQLRLKLASASGLEAELLSAFLTDFKFILKQPTLPDLEQYIRTVLLDKELGLTDGTIFLDLKEAIKQNAIFSRTPITIQFIDNLLEKFQSRLLIPQVFPVNYSHFLEQKSLSEQLDYVLPQVSGKYLIVTGLPGSGKSTSLTTYIDALGQSTYEVFKYYCFVSVNDNAQRMRVQAESLRANLISQFHRRYPSILKRRFDYSERNFLQCLTTLAKFFVGQGRQFIILLDGLDHAERLEQEIRETVISALPSDVPEGITFIVGTQELHKWPHFLMRARECQVSHINMPLFSESETKEYLENKRGITGLSRADIAVIHKKCEGLPLYLQYASEILITSESLTDAIDSLAPASDGDIRNYYRLLWDEFERVGMGKAKHLCSVMACLRFSVHRDELYRISTFDRPSYEDAYKYSGHLFRNFDERLTVFHNSFREFVLSQVSHDWASEIMKEICCFLKENKESPRWFSHVFKYCYDTENYTYILDEVNAEFVDRSLLHCRPSEEILESIDWAVESAFKRHDIVQLSRLGALKFRSHDRLEQNLSRTLLADALLALGREQDVITFAYSSEADHWLVDRHTSLNVLSSLAEEGKFELGQWLFDVFTKEFRGIHSDNSGEAKSQVIGIARCLGIYSKQQARPLKWLAQFKLKPDILEMEDAFAPGYEPHLASYINAVVQFGHIEKWKRLKQIKRIFPNNLIRYSLIRAFAQHNLLDELRHAISEYWEQECPSGNIELAFYAAKAGMPTSDVTAFAGTIGVPKATYSDYIPRSDPTLKHYAYAFIVIAYEDNPESYVNLCGTVGKTQTLWNSALQYLLKACYCIGCSFRSAENDWYEEACNSIAILVQAKQGDGERICESIELIRDVLPLTIGLLTEQIEKRYSQRLGNWIECLHSLRDSFLWNTHFGIMESRQDYDFELRLWENLAKIPRVRFQLSPILRSCADTYERSTKLKGGCRSDHFTWLSTIMAKCGMRNDADKWLRYGIRASLIYGYHKDITLLHLIDVLNLINQRQPDLALQRIARTLSMVDWMPHLTDGKETKWFPQKAFTAVLSVNRQAAFYLLKHFSQTKASWQMQDCLEEYLLTALDGDPEYLWCLTEIFSNHFSDDGRHCKQVMGTRQHIVNMVQKTCSEKIYNEFEKRFRNSVLTEITPRHWPESFKEELDTQVNKGTENEENANLITNPASEFMLDGNNITKLDIAEKCQISFPEFITTIEKLKNENKHFYERDIIEDALRYHIAVAKSLTDLTPITQHIETQGRWQNSNVLERLAERYLEFGDQNNAITSFGLAYSCQESWFPWKSGRKYLEAVAARDKQVARALVLKECYESISRTGGGYTAPPIAAMGLDVLNETRMLDNVFNDFLVHCESMFAQLPNDDNYAWLKAYKEPSFDENQLILTFVVDELSTPEIDHGERLIRAVTRLAIARYDDVIPLLVNEMILASGRKLRRLLTIFFTLATQRPDFLAPHQQAFSILLDREDFFCRQITLQILQYINQTYPLEASIASSVKRIERNYSTSIYYSLYRLPSNPTPNFKAFLKRHTLFDFFYQMSLIEKILQVAPGCLVAAIEERLMAQGWSMDKEQDRVKDDWYGNVHPQGWPVVFITTEFQELAADMLWKILDEAFNKLKLGSEQIRWIWQTIQPADPYYIIHGVMPRPRDIMLLNVRDKEAWFNELDVHDSMEIGDREPRNEAEGWITVFEKRRMAQDEQYNVPYRQEISLKAFLIPQQVYGGSHSLNELELSTERIVPTSSIAVTIKQLQTELHRRERDALDTSKDSIPLIAEHENPLIFFGILKCMRPRVIHHRRI